MANENNRDNLQKLFEKTQPHPVVWDNKTTQKFITWLCDLIKKEITAREKAEKRAIKTGEWLKNRDKEIVDLTKGNEQLRTRCKKLGEVNDLLRKWLGEVANSLPNGLPITEISTKITNELEAAERECDNLSELNAGKCEEKEEYYKESGVPKYVFTKDGRRLDIPDGYEVASQDFVPVGIVCVDKSNGWYGWMMIPHPSDNNWISHRKLTDDEMESFT